MRSKRQENMGIRCVEGELKNREEERLGPQKGTNNFENF